MGTLLDLIVILVYFFLILAFGTWFGRYVKTTKDFFFGGQRFSWWLIAMSCIATVVGSYSFIKYSAVAYEYGFSSTMSYLNDWFVVPLFILGWLPIIYFSKVMSIPEYFERRFNKQVRIVSVVILIIYLIGYVGINLYTIGVALEPMIKPVIKNITGFEIGVFSIAVFISIICAIYMHAGGQTSVIMTDLAQSGILLIAGFFIFYLGITKLGGLDVFWNVLPATFKLPFSGFNSPPNFSHVGIFWQDAFGSTIAFYFMNQGVLMRFMSVKSPREGKKAILMVVLVFMPLTAFAVSNAGWLGRAMVETGLLSSAVNSKSIFVEVANIIAVPGVFGFLMAALTAALMSTVDTLINAASAITVNDIVKEASPGNDDTYYLKWAKIAAIIAAALGLLLVPVYQSFESIYTAHGAFTAAVTPPMIVCILLAAFWKRFTTTAALSTLIGGSFMIVLSFLFPALISPFDHGVAMEGYNFMRALYGFIICMTIGISVSYFTKPKKDSEITGLVIDTIADAKRYYKNGTEPNDAEPGKKIKGTVVLKNIEGVQLSTAAMDKLKAKEGDIIYIADARWWLGGLLSVKTVALAPHDKKIDTIIISEKLLNEGDIDHGRPVIAEKII